MRTWFIVAATLLSTGIEVSNAQVPEDEISVAVAAAAYAGAKPVKGIVEIEVFPKQGPPIAVRDKVAKALGGVATTKANAMDCPERRPVAQTCRLKAAEIFLSIEKPIFQRSGTTARVLVTSWRKTINPATGTPWSQLWWQQLELELSRMNGQWTVTRVVSAAES